MAERSAASLPLESRDNATSTGSRLTCRNVATSLSPESPDNEGLSK
jgi:hypothetical protein